MSVLYCSKCDINFDGNFCPNCGERLCNSSIYIFPPLSLLKHGKKNYGESDEDLRKTAMMLQRTLQNYHVYVTVTNVSCGPSVTRYELQPEQGVRISSVVNLANEIQLNLAAPTIRIEAPIPGKAAIGIEVPSKENAIVMLRDLLEAEVFQNYESNVAFAIGRNITGRIAIYDMKNLSPLLITGVSKSGKSTCINSLIMSILYKSDPKDVKLIMIDPKVVELSVYNGIPHLMIPVVSDPKKAAGALNWAVSEMMKRCDLFAQFNASNLKGFNEKVDNMKGNGDKKIEKLPQIMIVIDGLADLMMFQPNEIESAIYQLSRLGSAVGIYLVISTNDISLDVVTKLIYQSISSRISFKTTTKTNCKTRINIQEEKKLLNNGDMLFYPFVDHEPVRIQGTFVSDEEIQLVSRFLEMHSDINPCFQNFQEEDRDAYFIDAGKFIIEKGTASIGMLQRVFKIGFNRAARIMDQLAEAGVVGEEKGIKPRKILMTLEEFENYFE